MGSPERRGTQVENLCYFGGTPVDKLCYFGGTQVENLCYDATLQPARPLPVAPPPTPPRHAA